MPTSLITSYFPLSNDYLSVGLQHPDDLTWLSRPSRFGFPLTALLFLQCVTQTLCSSHTDLPAASRTCRIFVSALEELHILLLLSRMSCCSLSVYCLPLNMGLAIYPLREILYYPSLTWVGGPWCASVDPGNWAPCSTWYSLWKLLAYWVPFPWTGGSMKGSVCLLPLCPECTSFLWAHGVTSYIDGIEVCWLQSSIYKISFT